MVLNSRRYRGIVLGALGRVIRWLSHFIHFLGHFFGRKIRPIVQATWELGRKRSRLSLVIGVLIAVYIAGGLYLGNQVYRRHKLTSTITYALKVYPLPAVIVDGRYITVLAAYKQIDYIEHFSQKTGQPVGSTDNIRNRVIDRLIEGASISKTAKQARLRVADQEVQDALNKVIEENGGEKAVLEVLQSLYGMTLPEFRQLIREQLLKQKVTEHVLTRIQVRHILIQDEKRARDVLEKIKGGGNFDELAKEFSQDSNSRDKGGDVGFVNRGQLPKEVEDVAFQLKPGEVAQDIVKSSLGFHIIRVDGRNEGKIDLSYDGLIKQFKEKKRIIKFLK